MAFTILVADDSETMRAVVKKTVEMSGIPIAAFFQAANGQEALKILENEWVDVILSDINMPVMSGVEMLRALKNDKVLGQIPVIFITTESSQARIDETTKLGSAGYVKKPFLPETIKKVLMDVLEKAYEQRVLELTPVSSGPGSDEMDF